MLFMRLLLLAAILLLSTSAPAQDNSLAQTPPMGWNSWDSYGTTINEQKFRASAAWVAEHLKPAGYQYVTIDEAWFDDNPPADGSAPKTPHRLDAYGRYIPSPDRFPSATDGKGFAPLADHIHSLGLKFGIHVLQGIPRSAVAVDSPIEGSSFRAKQVANVDSGCSWNTDNFDLKPGPAAQAYYDSIARLYVSWHVDLIKIDCIASHPYKGDEIRMFHEAIEKATATSGRPILISLSPGPAPLEEAANLQAYSQQWRISDDVWDVWQSTGSFPQGVNDQIARAAKWLPSSGPGHWPDADMLPLGRLGPAPGWGQPRNTRLTPDEQRTMVNLWAIVRSPLVYGGDPAVTDTATLALLTNPEVVTVDQHSHDNKNIILSNDLAIYTAQPDAGRGLYVAIFNRKDTPQTVSLPWSGLNLQGSLFRILDLWSHGTPGLAQSLSIDLRPHASALLRIDPAK